MKWDRRVRGTGDTEEEVDLPSVLRDSMRSLSGFPYKNVNRQFLLKVQKC